jgi:hypothetical protein
LMPEQERLSCDPAHAARAEEFREGNEQMDRQEEQIAPELKLSRRAICTRPHNRAAIHAKIYQFATHRVGKASANSSIAASRHPAISITSLVPNAQRRRRMRAVRAFPAEPRLRSPLPTPSGRRSGGSVASDAFCIAADVNRRPLRPQPSVFDGLENGALRARSGARLCHQNTG